MTDFFAGHILQGVLKNIQNIQDSDKKDFWLQVVKNLSNFYCQNPTINNYGNETEDPIFSVIDNQISRGLPTLTSIFIEREFEEIFGLTEQAISKIGSISFDFTHPNSTQYLGKLVLADNRNNQLNTENTYQTWEAHGGSDYEKVFFETVFSQFGQNANQLLQLQRPITSVVADTTSTKDIFANQNTDFVIEFPKYPNSKKGLIIEIDGSQHDISPQKEKDNLRNKFADENGFETVRVKTNEIRSIPVEKVEKIKTYLKHPYFQCFKKNILNPLNHTEEDLDYLQLHLSPFGIARIQKVIIKSLKKGLIDSYAQTIKIAIIERDIPCGQIAIDDLLLQIKHLSILQNKNGNALVLPKFEISIFNTIEFATAKLNAKNNCQIFNDITDFRSFDLVIDISVLNCATFINRPTKSYAQNTIVIRSLHHTENRRFFNFYKSIKYENVPESREDSRVEHLDFFLQSFFRKETFRDGQVEILSKALQKRNPIALLPTGAGKSLTYQVASLFQAGLVIVVDPIKALMKDQNENLKIILIDSSTYINSTLSPKQKAENTERYIRGEFIFAFVSPERFVIDDFRNKIANVRGDKNFAFCVIDEAHCVSEWGHDFRTAYLKLGDNSRKYCFSGITGENIPTLGLTGTASFDVLSDVQREVGLQNDSDIVRPEKLERAELKFKIKNIDANTLGVFGFWDIQKSVYEALKQGLLNILNNDLIAEPHLRGCNANSFSDFIKNQGQNSNCGIIFCPHSTEKMASGVKYIANYLRQQFPTIAHLIGEYYGSGDSNSLEKVQDDFKSNKITLLIATKAFGMGIDKPNIRFTIHLTHPISIEGFYQEAGRAGRDRDNAVCYILNCNNVLVEGAEKKKISVARKIQESFLFNSFKGEAYEKNITFELLDKITFPYTKNKDQLEEHIFENLGKEIKLGKPFPTAQPTMVYVNGGEFGQTYGNIKFNGLMPSTNGNNMDSIEEATFLLDSMVQFIKEKNAIHKPLTDWLNIVNSTPEKRGIEKFINNIPIGNTETITIGLENGGIQAVIDYLNPFSKFAFDYGMVKKATDYCQSDDEFIENLKKELKKTHEAGIHFNDLQKNDIKSLFTQIRLEQDTFKIIYRLSILGIVKDYTIQYPSFATLICQNQADEQIYENLYKHFKRYYPVNYVETLIKNARTGTEKTALRNCVNTLIDFTYANVFDKRQKALNNIEDAVTKSYQNTNHTLNLSKQQLEEEGNKAFIQMVNDYFDSQFVDEIRIVTENGTKIDFSVFQHFANKVENNDQLRQLENSSKRSLEFYNRNPVISLIQYYCSTLIHGVDNSELLYRTKELYVTENNFTFKQFDEILAEVSKEIMGKDKNSFKLHQKNIDSVLSRHALAQIKIFNQKILDQYVSRT